MNEQTKPQIIQEDRRQLAKDWEILGRLTEHNRRFGGYVGILRHGWACAYYTTLGSSEREKVEKDYIQAFNRVAEFVSAQMGKTVEPIK